MNLKPLLLLALLLFVPFVHADESMGAVHVTGGIGCPTIKWPMGSVRFDSNVTVKDSQTTGRYVIEYILSDIINHQTLVVALRETNTTHTFSAMLYQNRTLISKQLAVIHANPEDNFTLLNRKFIQGDFINFNLVPLDHSLSFQWYAKDPPFNHGAIIIAEGSTVNVPKNFNATDETLLFIGANGQNATFTNLSAYIQMTETITGTTSDIPLTSYQAYNTASPCADMTPNGYSNACEKITGPGAFDVQERMIN